MSKKPTKQELIDHVESLVAKCAELTRERDEARRLYCRAVEEIEHGMTNETERMVADYLGWDCFKEENANGEQK